MLTRVAIRNFKLFDDVELELGDRVVLIGPNNSGKTTALQALALWEIGLRRWLEKRGAGPIPKKRTGGTINRRDLIAVPVPAANLLWRNLRVRSSRRTAGGPVTQNVRIEIQVDGVGRLNPGDPVDLGLSADDNSGPWSFGLEFDFANSESFYCRPLRDSDDEYMAVPEAAAGVRIAYLPPMSGLAANEIRLEAGAINVRLGEGRTAEVIRNLCYQIAESEHGGTKWAGIAERIESLFGSQLDTPEYVAERGEVAMTYRTRDGVRLDLSSSGRGQLQTLLLLAHMTANPGSVLLLDEPDAHLEILRQRQIYQILGETAKDTGSQIVAASHSEILLNEAAGRDVLIAFVGKPHRINDQNSQVAKALKEIGFDQYLQAEEAGWVLYLEGSTDLAILREMARQLGHPAVGHLEKPYVHYVGNQPKEAQKRFYGMREAKPELAGIAVYDRLPRKPPTDPNLTQHMWQRCEIENYVCKKRVLLDYATDQGRRHYGELFAEQWRRLMQESIGEVERALATLGDPSPWGPDIKAGDQFLDPVFKRFFQALKMPNLMAKSNYHELAGYLKPEDIDDEVKEVLDLVAETAGRAET